MLLHINCTIPCESYKTNIFWRFLIDDADRQHIGNEENSAEIVRSSLFRSEIFYDGTESSDVYFDALPLEKKQTGGYTTKNYSCLFQVKRAPMCQSILCKKKSCMFSSPRDLLQLVSVCRRSSSSINKKQVPLSSKLHNHFFSHVVWYFFCKKKPLFVKFMIPERDLNCFIHAILNYVVQKEIRRFSAETEANLLHI